MTLLLIQYLRREYMTIGKAISEACITEHEKDKAYAALYSLASNLILSNFPYRDMKLTGYVADQSSLDMKYVQDALSEEEMKQREEWHWERILEQNPLPKD